MYELIQAGEHTYYIKQPGQVGIYKINEQDVYLIDTGNDKDAGRKIFKILSANNWALAGIINTTPMPIILAEINFYQQKTGCKIISTEIENTFARHPILEPSFLYGGYPFKGLRNKFLMANSCEPTHNIDNYLPDGLEYFRLGVTIWI